MGKYKGRVEGYVEDSTKGGAMMLPRSYKGDVLVQVWIDSRVLATLSLWLDKGGNYTRFMSEIVKDTLRTVQEHLVERGEVEMVDDTAEARDMLERKYRVDLNPSGRGLKNAHHNMLLSEKRKSLGGDVEYHVPEVSQIRDHVPISRKKSQAINTLANDLFERYNKRMRGQREDAKREGMKKHHEEMKYDKNGVCIQETKSTSAVTKEDMEQWNREGAAEQREKYKVPAEVTKPIKHSDIPRKLTEEELDEKLLERERKDEEQLEAFKKM